MPARMTDAEREHIRSELIVAALESIKRAGIKHTTIDGLVNCVQLPKGTFYLLYPSKEKLILDALTAEREELAEYLDAKIKAVLSQEEPAKDTFIEQVTQAMTEVFWKYTGMAVTHAIINNEMIFLQRKLPDDVRDVNQKYRSLYTNTFQQLPLRDLSQAEEFSIAFETLFYSLSIQFDYFSLTEEQFQRFLTTVFRGIVIQMF